ncbi:hypothetical protein P7K49_036355 [Saguinus oedipus]|uniref:Putative monooxygenase p33MONOX n=1 Tax=Saguinus oedipus TaxID=9490 RepID=A0ABQ9TJV0_SAGOE|nr:hypothetical protein P7K49_036355 [Saguinus oedipus]
MTPPPSDMGSIPWKPVIPEYKYQHLAKVEDPPMALSLATDKAQRPGHLRFFDILTWPKSSTMYSESGDVEVRTETNRINGASLDQDLQKYDLGGFAIQGNKAQKPPPIELTHVQTT